MQRFTASVLVALVLVAYDDSVVDFSGGFYEIVTASDSASLDIRDAGPPAAKTETPGGFL